MAKMNERELERLKRIQDIDDDDAELDITKRARFRAVEQKEKAADVDEEDRESPEEKKKNTKNLLIVIGFVVLMFLLFYFLVFFGRQEKNVMTVDELHEANLAGRLEPEKGYVYNGYSFVKFGDLWYSRLQKNDTVYDITFNYDPKSVENISVSGQLEGGFKRDGIVHITFDPTGNDLKYVAVSNYGLSRSLARAFGYNITAACTKNITAACQKAGVVLCGEPGNSVIYFKEDDKTEITLKGTCVTVQGRGEEIIRAKDRLLLRWYGVDGRE
jgi:hypothetical protein